MIDFILYFSGIILLTLILLYFEEYIERIVLNTMRLIFKWL